MGYSAERHEALFDKDVAVYQEAERGSRILEWIRQCGHDGIWLYSTRRSVAGDYIVYKSFPVWISRKEAERAKRATVSTEAQEKLNIERAREKVDGLTCANFTEDDLFVHYTYGKVVPLTAEELRRDIQACIRRLRNHRKKNGMPDLKYIYTMEYLGKTGQRVRPHIHMVMSGMDIRTVKKIWGNGHVTFSPLEPDENGYSGLAKYITKPKGRPEGEQKYCCSRNLKKPKVTYSDRRLTKRDVLRLIGEEDRIREAIQRREKNEWIVNSIEVKRSDWVPGAYVTVRLRRVAPRGSPPGKKKKDGKT